MRILVLHGWFGNSRFKAALLARRGHIVCRPTLSNLSFAKAVRQAQNAHNEFLPDVVVGSSRGGAVAMSLDTSARLVLLAPAWRRFHVEPFINTEAVILHGRKDTVIALADSLTLGLYNTVTVQTIEDTHRLSGRPSLRAILLAAGK